MEAGARFAAYTLLRLPLGVGPLFEAWLEQHFPGKKERVLGRVRAAHGGQLNDSRFGVRMVGEGALAEQVRALFRLTCTRLGIGRGGPSLLAAGFRRPGGQLMLFE
jgi:DNA repair photolyase